MATLSLHPPQQQAISSQETPKHGGSEAPGELNWIEIDPHLSRGSSSSHMLFMFLLFHNRVHPYKRVPRHPLLVASSHTVPHWCFFFFFWPAVTALGWGSLFWSGGQSLDPIPKLLPELSLELREPAACIRQVGQCCWWLSKLFRSQWHTLLALWDEFLPGLGLMCHVPALSGSHRRLTGTSRRQRWAWTEGWCPVQGSALPVLHPPISWSNNPSLCYLH